MDLAVDRDGLSSSPALSLVNCGAMHVLFNFFKPQVSWSLQLEVLLAHHPRMFAVRISWNNALKLFTVTGLYNSFSKKKKKQGNYYYNSTKRD